MVASDTTVPRVLEGIEEKGIVEMPYEVIKKLDRQGYWDWILSTGRKMCSVGMMDGSCFGGFWASVLMLAGASQAVVDLEPYEKRGKELAASRIVLKRANQKLGKGFFDLILADGLYPTQEDFKLCREELESDLLVKTSEETLTVIGDARDLFFTRRETVRKGISRIEGVDKVRDLKYEVVWANGFEWNGLEYPMTVAFVREKSLKPNILQQNNFDEFIYPYCMVPLASLLL